MKQLDALWPKCVRHKGQARDVSTGASEGGDESRFDGIGHTHHDDWDGLSGFLSRLHGRRINGDNHLDLEQQKFFYKQGGRTSALSRRRGLFGSTSVPFVLSLFHLLPHSTQAGAYINGLLIGLGLTADRRCCDRPRHFSKMSKH